MFPLSLEQISALQNLKCTEAKIISLSCDEFHYHLKQDVPLKSLSDIDQNSHSTGEIINIEHQLKDLEEEIKTLIEIRQEQTIPEVQSLKKDIEISYDKSRKAKIGGTVATVTGSTLGIVGFGLAFVTFGASLSLSIIGGVIGAAGGATVAGADIGYTVVWKKRMKRVKMVCESEQQHIQRVQNLIKQIHASLEELTIHFPQNSLSASHMVDIGRAAVVAGDAAKIGTQIAARTALRTVATAGRAIGAAGAALDAVLLPVDIFVMVKAAMDVHKYQGGKGKSNSKAAREVGKILVELEEHTEKIINMHNELLKT